MKHIILTGLAGSGKDTVADYLCETHGFVKLSLAKKINDIAEELYGTYGYNIKEKVKYRNILQSIGGNARDICERNFGRSDVWSEYLNRQAEEIQKEKKYNGIVISDGRYIDEVNYFTKKGYLPILILCPMEKIKERLIIRDGSFDASVYKDKSEKDAVYFTNIISTVIWNNLTKEESFRQVDKILLGGNTW